MVRSSTVLAASTTTAIPSMATMFSATPSAFSSSFKFLEELPISAVPLLTASTPAPDPTNSAVTVTPGCFSIKDSLSALANFSMEVDPTILMVPLKSADGAFSAFAASVSFVSPDAAEDPASVPASVAGAAVPAAVVSGALLPQPARIPMARTAVPNSTVNFFPFILIIRFLLNHIVYYHVFCYLFYSLEYT